MSRRAKLKREIWRRLRPLVARIGQEELRSTLARLTGGAADILFVHSSLSSCGHFIAGPEGVLSALREQCRTLCLPAHSYCYPAQLGELGPVFDAARTPSQNGLLTETFRLQAGVKRSIHSTHSFAAWGNLADEICTGHYLCNSPCGAGTPYARLLQRKTSALLFGLTFHPYTFYHTAEDAAGSAFAYEPETVDRLRVVDEQGVTRERLSRRQTRNPRRFAQAGDLLERVGLARSIALGRNQLHFVPDCAKVHDFLVERLRAMPDFLFETCAGPLQ